MLTEKERIEIEHEISKFQHKHAAAPEALKIVQQYRGWVSDETLTDVADFLDMTVDELDAVATCYNLIFRKPVGRHVIFICDSVSCWVMGYDGIREHLTSRLGIDVGQTTTDGRFTLLPIACLGACDKAPAMIVDQQLYGNLNPQKIDLILDSHH